ncbi:hypothetical protein BDV96DRAFT_234186 [Lophiotrema nucula]|uniref:Guanylate kinase-like domain-containing protein n=1 Tax=Lophiotrema nucula TaxID=690887 RepID=A0A6A5YRY7_9PLEO|nr:hypothetical protein BDV96DRAFT_234186 [Lophiotrema nucula]
MLHLGKAKAPCQIPTYETFKKTYDPTKKVGVSPRVKHFKEKLEREIHPDDPWFHLKRHTIRKLLQSAGGEVKKTIENTEPKDRKLRLWSADFLLEAQTVPDIKPYVITIVGKQGYGKSTLTNALLCEFNLADASPGAKACTQFPTKYVFRPGPRGKKDVHVHFLDEESRQAMFTELLEGYRFYHTMPPKERETSTDEKTKAKVAETVFGIVMDVRNKETGAQKQAKLTQLLRPAMLRTKETLREILRELLDASKQRIDNARADDAGVAHSYGVVELSRDEVRANATKLYPIVEYVVVAVSSYICEHNIVLIDVPGVGDADHIRMSKSYAIREHAHHEFIVAEPTRVLTDLDTIRLLEESIRMHGAENTTLVVNKNDDIANDDGIWATIRTLNFSPFKELRKFREASLSCHRRQQQKENESEEEAEEYCSEEEGDEELQEVEHPEGDDLMLRSAYNKELTTFAQQAFITYRESLILQELKKTIKAEVQIFAVAAGKYIGWLDPMAQDPKWTTKKTRIPHLRSFALSLKSPQNYEIYNRHCFRTLPDRLVDKLRIVLAGHQDDAAYSGARSAYEGVIPLVKSTIEADFEELLPTLLPQMWLKPKDKKALLKIIGKVVWDWGRLPWKTFDKVLREQGIPIKSGSRHLKELAEKKHGGRQNMNFAILQKMMPDVDEWKDRFYAAVMHFRERLKKSILSMIDPIGPSFQTQLIGDSLLKHRVISEWNKTHRNIREFLDNFEDVLKGLIRIIHVKATSETDIRGTICQLNHEIYLEASQVERGEGTNKRQRNACRNGLVELDAFDRTFLDRYEDCILTFCNTMLVDVFIVLNERINRFLQDYLKVMQDLLESNNEEAAINPDLRGEVEAAIPGLEATVTEVQDLFPKPVEEETVEQEVEIPPAKRAKAVPTHSRK